MTGPRPASRRLRHTLAAAGAAFALVSGALPTPAFAATAAPAVRHPFAPHVAEASQRFAIPEVWIWRVMHVESRGNARAVSRAGAMGAMQIMPATWRMLSARHRLGSDPFDARANILAGAAYLRAMWDRYRDVRLMLAAYNAGPGRADAYAAGRRGLPSETIAYVALIAPSLGAEGGAAQAAPPPAAQPGWREASVFAPHSGHAASRDAPPAERRDDAQGPPVPALFFPLSGRPQ